MTTTRPSTQVERRSGAAAAWRRMLRPVILMLAVLACGHAHAQQWNDLYFPSEQDGFGGFFTDSLTGVISTWYFGPGGISAEIYHTANGGASWTQALSNNGAIFAIGFADNSTGYAVGADPSCNCGGVYSSSDGGRNWSLQQSVPEATPSLYAVHFVTSAIGFIGGDDGTLLKTTNGGVSWTSLSTGTSGVFRNIQFVDVNNGFAVVAEPENSLQGEKLFKTTNGGSSWEQITFQNFVPMATWFTTPEVGFVVGNGGRPDILRTTDAGTTWTRVFRGTASGTFFLSIQFVTPYVGYASGGDASIGNAGNGFIASTTDGGRTWTQERSNLPQSVRWLRFPTERVGYAIGTQGKMMKTQRTPIPNPKPSLKASKGTLDFGAMGIGDSRSLSFDISPENLAGITVQSIELPDALIGRGFSYTTSKPLPQTLNTGEKVTVNVVFAPTAAGEIASILSINSNDDATPKRTISLLASVSAAEQPSAVLSADTLEFGEVAVGSTKELTLEVSPANGAGLAVDSVRIVASGVGAGDLTVRTSSPLPALLSGGERLTITVEYAPKSEHATTARLVVRTNDQAATHKEVGISASSRIVASVGDRENAGGFELRAEPNPARGSAAIILALAKRSDATIDLYSIEGRLIRRVFDGAAEAGERSFPLDLRGLAPGIYVCTAVADGHTRSTRVVITE